MPRPRYQITAADLTHARAYLESQLLQLTLDLRELTHGEALDAVNGILRAGGKSTKTKKLNTWCETHLTTAAWAGLKASVRKRRQRFSTETRSVTLSIRAHKLLKDAAERKGVTMSRIIEQRLGRR
ncbi:MAG TPA: hypothetical protein DDW52_06360 [Planctomycetaceae bacterium]|nr:hypothetical protein [Planctomycetaceae bacterium]